MDRTAVARELVGIAQQLVAGRLEFTIYMRNGKRDFDGTADGFKDWAERDYTYMGLSENKHLSPKLQGLPTFKELAGPMDNGPGRVRYETWEVYNMMSSSVKTAENDPMAGERLDLLLTWYMKRAYNNAQDYEPGSAHENAILEAMLAVQDNLENLKGKKGRDAVETFVQAVHEVHKNQTEYVYPVDYLMKKYGREEILEMFNG